MTIFAASAQSETQPEKGEWKIRALDIDESSSAVESTEQSVSPVAKRASREGSVFDNYSKAYVKSPDSADPDYRDTEFGELLYNEASLPTRLEILRLLSKDTPSMLVFMQAISMGLGIDDVLQAAIRYEPNKGRDFAQSAISLLPVVSDMPAYIYAQYQLEDLERDETTNFYQIQDVVDRFFNDRKVLTPYPDWLEGQAHFWASARELKSLSKLNPDIEWYRNKSTETNSDRPIFVSLYEANQAILVDGEDRIDKALAEQGEGATLPVVFIYNRLNERPIDQLGYPKTIRGIQKAFSENNLMITPAPEWQIGEYNLWTSMEEIYEVFDIPEEDDFEPEYWQRLLEEAEAYKVSNTAFILILLSAGEDDVTHKQYQTGVQYASLDDPRIQEEFPYTPANGDPISLKVLASQGFIMTRPDLVAALKALGVTHIPVAFYYIDSARTKPYSKGPRGLAAFLTGFSSPRPPTGGGGGFGVCASPPCVIQQ